VSVLRRAWDWIRKPGVIEAIVAAALVVFVAAAFVKAKLDAGP
jgi:hypothetical protein